MATRFYYTDSTLASSSFGAVGGGVVSVAIDSGWEVLAGTSSGLMYSAPLVPASKMTTLNKFAFPAQAQIFATSGVTNDGFCCQFISPPLSAQAITGTISTAIGNCLEAATTVNATLALSVRLVSNDGSTVRGTLYSIFGTDTEFATSPGSTRIVNAASLTNQTAVDGDRIVAEIGISFSAPTSSSSATLKYTFGSNYDLALTSGVDNSTNLYNSWLEVSQDLTFQPAPFQKNILKPRPFSPGLAR